VLDYYNDYSVENRLFDGLSLCVTLLFSVLGGKRELLACLMQEGSSRSLDLFVGAKVVPTTL